MTIEAKDTNISKYPFTLLKEPLFTNYQEWIFYEVWSDKDLQI